MFTNTKLRTKDKFMKIVHDNKEVVRYLKTTLGSFYEERLNELEFVDSAVQIKRESISFRRNDLYLAAVVHFMVDNIFPNEDIGIKTVEVITHSNILVISNSRGNRKELFQEFSESETLNLLVDINCRSFDNEVTEYDVNAGKATLYNCMRAVNVKIIQYLLSAVYSSDAGASFKEGYVKWYTNAIILLEKCIDLELLEDIPTITCEIALKLKEIISRDIKREVYQLQMRLEENENG